MWFFRDLLLVGNVCGAQVCLDWWEGGSAPNSERARAVPFDAVSVYHCALRLLLWGGSAGRPTHFSTNRLQAQQLFDTIGPDQDLVRVYGSWVLLCFCIRILPTTTYMRTWDIFANFFFDLLQFAGECCPKFWASARALHCFCGKTGQFQHIQTHKDLFWDIHLSMLCHISLPASSHQF